MRFGFVTCVQLGLSCLEEMQRLGSSPDLVLTLKDNQARNKSGRVWLDEFCQAAEVPLVKVRHINDDDAIKAILEADLDWLFIIGWSQIASKEVLRLPRMGCVGMHPTLLPQGRGRASIPWAIIKGLERTGVSMFVLDEGVDTGPIIAQQVIELSPEETATSLYERVNSAHVQLIRHAWPGFIQGTVKPQVQDESQATEWPGRRPEDGVLNSTMTTTDVERHVRALTPPYPGATWTDADGSIWVIESGNTAPAGAGALEIPTRDGTYWASAYRRAEDAENS